MHTILHILLFLGIAIGALVIAAFVRIRFRRSTGKLLPESLFKVRWDENEIVCERPEGVVERVAWNDIQAVVIETNDRGPCAADVHWIILGTGKSGCVFPSGATGEGGIIEAFKRLPGFDYQAVIDAGSCTSNQTFLCWKREGESESAKETK